MGCGKQPAEVAFEPGDEVCTQHGFVGLVLRCLGFGLEDALAGCVVQVGDLGGFAVFGEAGLAVAVGAGEGLGEAEQLVAACVDVQGLGSGLGFVGLVEVAVEVAVAGGFAESAQAVAVGVVAVAGLGAGPVKAGDAVSAVGDLATGAAVIVGNATKLIAGTARKCCRRALFRSEKWT